jgi:hypothetical protein
VDRPLYAAWAAIATLSNARAFYGSMWKQTGGEWSAPLDDVFIHFDYARATAEGHPFEWVVGNGYSSGNTSLSYPFVLAAGYVVGFRELSIMVWAAIVAAMCCFGLLLAVRPLFPSKAASYFAPVAFFWLGALDWSLWSGMEVAFFLGMWALALLAWQKLEGARFDDLAGAGWWLGAAGAALVVTRPEAMTTIAAFGLVGAWGVLHRFGARSAWKTLLRVGSPAAALLLLQTACNRLLTGEWTANGAIVKLAVNNPFLTPDEKLADYTFNLKYSILRNLEYHFTDDAHVDFIVPALAFAALAIPETRKVAVLLLLQLVGWFSMVAMNGQVRWQNERYTMPGVAWLLLVAAVGATALARRAGRPHVLPMTLGGAMCAQLVALSLRPGGEDPTFRLAWVLALGAGLVAALLLRYWPARVLAVSAAVVLAYAHQEHKMRDQRWFFGRASRNIRDQHVVAGRWLGAQKARRILVGDAGALIYASERPGLDIIGLGGLGKLPFARAGVHGLPATLELMEHLPAADRPDVFAIYPSWWGVLPTWFTSAELARFPAEGNVICGGYEDVIYKADWHLLGTGNRLRTMPADSVRVVDSVDVADLLSEKEHDYEFPHPAGGWTDMKILPDPMDPTDDMFDGGRRIGKGRSERFVVRGLARGQAARFVVRSAPDGRATVHVRVGGAEVDRIDFARTEGWLEKDATVPAASVTPDLEVELANDGPDDFIDYHVWVTQ